MDLACFLYLTFITFSLIGSNNGQPITTVPDDATGTIGGKAHFKCQVELGTIVAVTWEFNDRIIYSYLDGEEDYPGGKGKYSVTPDGNIFSLTVSDLKLKDGGIYSCLTITASAVADLVVLGTPEIISLAPRPKSANIAMYSCKAEFGGPSKEDISPDHYPQLQMFLGDEPLVGTVSEQRSEGSYKLATQPHSITLMPGIYRNSLLCEISTTNPKMALTCSTEINMMYPVQNVGYSPVQATYSVGSVINCTADGFPRPPFKWEHTVNEFSGNSRQEASDPYLGNMKTFAVINGLVCIVALIAMLIVVCLHINYKHFRRRHRNRNDNCLGVLGNTKEIRATQQAPGDVESQK